jgi:hypothetical protein
VLANAFVEDEVDLRQVELASLCDQANDVALERGAVVFGRPGIAREGLRSARPCTGFARRDLTEDLVPYLLAEAVSDAVRTVAGEIGLRRRAEDGQRDRADGHER